MLLKEIKKSKGALSTIIIVLIVIVVIALVIAFLATRNQKPKTQTTNSNTPPPPVYDLTINSIRFLSISALEEGNTLSGKLSKHPQSQEDLTTTERFIKVTVGAQNVAKVDTKRDDWDLGKIVDSDGRMYGPVDASSWITEDNFCSTILKPSFQPSLCIRYYDVARVAKGLKIQVMSKGSTGLIDLKGSN